jgi:hypothetical protein
MQYESIVVSLPVADRPTSFAFYQGALELEPVGELADDGIPEPLQFVLNSGLNLMLIPTGGFGWTIGEGRVVATDAHETILVINASSIEEADARIGQAVAAGARITTPPTQQPWGYSGSFADPDGHIWMVRAG